jgi:integrase
MKQKRKKWVGGYIRKTRSGKSVYVIERWARGKRVHVSTGCTTKEGAEAELARFEADPLRYVPGGVDPDGVFLTEERVLQYSDHQLSKGLTVEWVQEVARCLVDWSEALEGLDLRQLRLHQDIKPALERWQTQRPHRIKALKGFCRWLREEKGALTRSQDATLDLKVPQARPEKQRRRKVVAPEDVAAVLRELPEVTRDVLHLMSATAWHQSEVRRFAAGGEIVVPMKAEGVLAVLITRHKSGDLTKTPIVYEEHLAAAKRLRERGNIPTRMTIARHMRAAIKAAGVPGFGTGQMRHSVLTWGVRDGGASIADAKEFGHHRSEQTTKRFYVDLDIPKPALPVYRLT